MGGSMVHHQVMLLLGCHLAAGHSPPAPTLVMASQMQQQNRRNLQVTSGMPTCHQLQRMMVKQQQRQT